MSFPTRVILTGGGTAGHIWPIIAIAERLRTNRRAKILYIGSSGPERKIAQNYGIPFKSILVGKRRNYFSLSNFIDLFKIFLGLVQAFFYVFFFKPNIIFGKGGYVTFPVLFWAKIFKIPIIIHESDTVMGQTNRWAANFAKKICLGFPIRYYSDLPIEKAIYTGIPVRREFLESQFFKKKGPTILIMGGSQGSVKINEIIAEILPDLLKKYEIFHLAGEKNLEELKRKFSFPNYHLFGFSNEMPRLMENADLIISRSGANTLAEISALGKPSILIPLPSAHMDHQKINAQIYQERNAAVVLSEKSLIGNSLLSIINRLMEDSYFRELLGHHAREFARENATETITDLIFSLAKR